MKKILFGLMMVMSCSVMAQVKVGFVNSQELLDTMPSRKSAETKYLAFEKESYEEVQLMQQEIQKMYEDYERDRPNLTQVMAQSRERKIMERQQMLESRGQSLQQELQAYSNELNAPILERVQEAVKIVSERKKLTYVVDQTTVLYFDPAMDITKEVATELLKLEASVAN